MKNIIRFILRLVQNPIVLAILWFGVAIRGFWVSWTEGLANNYLIFSRSFFSYFGANAFICRIS